MTPSDQDNTAAPASFKDLCLAPSILKNLEALGFTTPTPIQEQTIPALLSGRDVLGQAQTGTGKTAAFGLPLAQQLISDDTPRKGKRPLRGLVIAPTRELALQIVG